MSLHNPPRLECRVDQGLPPGCGHRSLRAKSNSAKQVMSSTVHRPVLGHPYCTVADLRRSQGGAAATPQPVSFDSLRPQCAALGPPAVGYPRHAPLATQSQYSASSLIGTNGSAHHGRLASLSKTTTMGSQAARQMQQQQQQQQQHLETARTQTKGWHPPVRVAGLLNLYR